MRTYKKVIKSYEIEVTDKCYCDKYGKLCEVTKLEEDIIDKRTSVEIKPQFTDHEYANIDLCPECTKKLLKWFNQDIEEIKILNNALNFFEGYYEKE